jgi:protein tyrosine phosphatase (PTP) superfamily phosphohydrolase (DUF442 family)
VTHNGWTEPRLLAGIRNFGWAVPGVLARGEQPALEAATFEALHAQGIRTIVSLRPDGEAPPAVARRIWPEYLVDDERRLAEASGMRFRHVPMDDFSAPTPHQVARALTAIDKAVQDAPAIYVHCRAGAGRAVVVSGAWMMAHGQAGDVVADMYERCMHHIAESVGLSGDEMRAMLRRVGQPFTWWAIRKIAAALDSPVTRDIDLLPPEQPPGAETWAYREALAPWLGEGSLAG